MAGWELMPDEFVVRETLVQHFRRWRHMPVRTLTLTNQRLMLWTSGFDPTVDDLRDVFTRMLTRSDQLLWEVRLEELSTVTRTKFGLNDRVVLLESRSGELQKLAVDKFQPWIDAIYDTVNSTGVVEMVEAEPDRWVVS